MSTIIVYGMGKTGQCLNELLKREGHNVIMYDDNSAVCKITLDQLPIDMVDKIIVSPGVKPNAPLIELARQHNIDIECELQYCFDRLRGQCVSVTGTNGKTTVTQMIHHILTECNKSAYLLGNGGIPLSSCVDKLAGNDIVVHESSSFQLMYCTDFFPKISLITNLAPDHIDYHGSYQDYISAKQKNCQFQRANQYAIFNLDDKNCTQLAQNTQAQKLFYSISDSSANCYIDSQANIVLNLHDIQERSPFEKIKHFSKINLSNALGALLVCNLLGITLSEGINALSSFHSDRHRMELVGTFNDITYIDDSKATNVHATVNAIQSLEKNVVVVLGGSDKGEDFSKIFKCDCLCGAVVLGATAERLLRDAQRVKFANITECNSMESAVLYATKLLQGKKGYVLLSPACASFDCYHSYAERGEHFIKVVRELEHS